MRGKMKKLIILLLCLLPYALTCQEKQTKDSPRKETATDSIPGWMKKAEDLAHQGNIPEASALYIRIMKLEPHNKQAVQGWLMANMKRSPTGEQEAIQSLEELGKTYPENSAILFWKLFLHAEYGHNEEALRLAEALIALQPDSGINWLAKGQILYGMERYQEAVEAFDQSMGLGQDRADVYGMKASALLKLGKSDAAISTATKGIELFPGNAYAIYNRACIYSLKGDKVAALADLKKALEINPRLKQHARQDEDLKSLREDEEFKTITQ